ncbi:MAG: bifunctional phosphoglucose/phosphomannose isomerase [Euryarchaeota archaeon RBG_16_68_13]|nr:MAG: bifunctional phosphoglucose/phosphomannose isomerase [Euryarchaeota archaeon RBG_16_68_13]
MLDAAAIAKTDPGGLGKALASLPEQLENGLRRGLGTHVGVEDASRIFIVGLGGSAIAGDVFASWVADRSKVPIQVVRDYRLPSYAQPGDLLVAVSYSGTTEETLAATAQGIKLGCRLVAVTSGGTLARLAGDSGGDLIEVPGDLPAPRASFGHLFGILPAIGETWVYGDLPGELRRAVVRLKQLREEIRPDVPLRKNRAKLIATRLKDRTPILYGAPPMVPVAKRWQTQLNENAKVVAFASAFPEADHNELVGWCEDPSAKRFAPILLRDRDESPEMRRRLDATAAMMNRRTKVESVEDDSEEILGRMLGLLYLGDFVSLYVAALRRVDPLPVLPIAELKARLAPRTRAKN